MLFWNWLKKGLASKSIEATQLDSVDGLPGLACSPDLPAAFGFKTTWLAVRSTDADAVFDALRLQDKTCANWESGVSFAHSGGVTNGRVGVYVSPQIDGWTLVVTGHGFMTTSEENAQRVKDILQNLSRTFGECQYFGSHKVKGFCAWFKATDGKLERAFSLVGGQVFLNEGFADAAELDATPLAITNEDVRELKSVFSPGTRSKLVNCPPWIPRATFPTFKPSMAPSRNLTDADPAIVRIIFS